MPLWWFMVTAVAAIFVGRLLRWYWFKRKARKADEVREEERQRKIRMKRQKKLMKKAARK